MLRLKYGGDFNIFNSSLIKKFKCIIFDENYICGAEDIDLAWRLRQNEIKERYVDFEVGDIIGGTIGPYNIVRRTRELANACYLNSKITSGELRF